MKNYDSVNNSYGTTIIKVLFQVGEYTGSLTYEIGGNCKGLDALPHDGMSILDNLGTAKFEGMNIIPYNIEDDWFAKVFLTNDFKETLEYDVESESEFEQMIVGMQIIDFEEESDEDD